MVKAGPVTPEDLVGVLIERGQKVVTAESLTGGLVCAALTSVPGSSACVRGGNGSYAVAVKADVLGVDGVNRVHGVPRSDGFQGGGPAHGPVGHSGEMKSLG